VNHEPAASISHWNHDGNNLEMLIDTFNIVEEATAFIMSEEFEEENLYSIEEEFLEKLKAGVPVKE